MRRVILSSVMVVLGVLLACGVALAAAGDTTRVSVSSSGAQGNGVSVTPSVSADGRFVAFYSESRNLVQGDTNGTGDIFVRDRQTGTTRRVSVDSSGNQANDGSGEPSISADGRFVAFSSASKLVPSDTNIFVDIFVRDRRTGTTERVSVSSSGSQAFGSSSSPSISADGRFVAFASDADRGAADVFVRDRRTNITERVTVSSSGNLANGYNVRDPSISADGRFVAFASDASNLVPGDTRDFDVFVRDRQTNTTRRVSVNSSGNQANRGSRSPSISADGRFVAFGSVASNLVPGDTNGFGDIFVRDRQTGTTKRVSVSSSGNQVSGRSLDPSISADGRFVAFASRATNLVAGDTNDVFDVFVHVLEPDAEAPRVTSVAPARGATAIGTRRSVRAAFSERVYYVKPNFVLHRQGSGTHVAAVVRPVKGTANTKWVLNPNRPLRAGTTYVARVKTGVVDKVGNHLDQRPNLSGKQPMKWTFKTRR